MANLGGGRQVIRVKNCSGNKLVMWSGAWNPDDTRWANLPPGIQRELDAETFHDGGFWMAYGDFLKYFQVITQPLFSCVKLLTKILAYIPRTERKNLNKKHLFAT